MKDKVLKLLQDKKTAPEEQYNQAMALYRKSEGKSVPAQDYYNRAGFTAINLKNIKYDLQKLYGIADADLVVKKKKQKSAYQIVQEKLKELLANLTDEVKTAVAILIADPSREYSEDVQRLIGPLDDLFLDNDELFVDKEGSPLSKEESFALFTEACKDFELPEEILSKLQPNTDNGTDGTKTNPSGTDNGENGTEIPENGTEVSKNDTNVAENGTEVAKNDTDILKSETFKFTSKLEDLEPDAKEGLSLIVQFPFLDADDCPSELKILVQDKFTAWRKFRKLHAELITVTDEGKEPRELDNAEIFELAKEAIGEYEKNHAIYDELNYYGEHKEILGKHPIFADKLLAEKVANLSEAKAVQRRNNLRTYISRDTPKVATASTPNKAKKIQDKLDSWNKELALLEERLGKK